MVSGHPGSPPNRFLGVPWQASWRNWAALSARRADFSASICHCRCVLSGARIGFCRANTITQLCDKPNMMLSGPKRPDAVSLRRIEGPDEIHRLAVFLQAIELR